MQPCTISRALRGTRCWCGKSAEVTRAHDELVSHYCARHWALWWHTLLSNPMQAPVQVEEIPHPRTPRLRKGVTRHA